jgi:hypothetical protein
MTKITRVLTVDEYLALDDQVIAAGDRRRIFVPGMAWFEPWYWDHDGSWKSRGKYVMCKERPTDPNVNGFLSPHFWRDWADKRPPICVVCPNGEMWEIDRWSSNGTGWTVTGELPNITCAPSIVVEGYHGFLRDGEFTADLEGRGPNGRPR